MKHRPLLLLVLLGAIALPQSAWANAGTPLMWAEILHLTIGNLLIGVGEGLLLAWLFSTPKGKSVVLFQLGQDQICAFDPATRRVALLWRGRGPVPVIEK